MVRVFTLRLCNEMSVETIISTLVIIEHERVLLCTISDSNGR